MHLPKNKVDLHGVQPSGSTSCIYIPPFSTRSVLSPSSSVFLLAHAHTQLYFKTCSAPNDYVA